MDDPIHIVMVMAYHGRGLLLLLLLTSAGCHSYGILAKRESELNCPTDIRKTVPWCAGEDAVFRCPCGPDQDFYGHKPTRWGIWPAPGAEWRDVYCGNLPLACSVKVPIADGEAQLLPTLEPQPIESAEEIPLSSPASEEGTLLPEPGNSRLKPSFMNLNQAMDGNVRGDVHSTVSANETRKYEVQQLLHQPHNRSRKQGGNRNEALNLNSQSQVRRVRATRTRLRDRPEQKRSSRRATPSAPTSHLPLNSSHDLEGRSSTHRLVEAGTTYRKSKRRISARSSEQSVGTDHTQDTKIEITHSGKRLAKARDELRRQQLTVAKLAKSKGKGRFTGFVR